MAKRYSIRARMHGSDHESEICQVDTNPQQTLNALTEKTLKTSKSRGFSHLPKYTNIRIVDLHEVDS